MRIVPVFLAAALFLTPSGDVQSVLAKPRMRAETADFRATGHLVRVDAGGSRTSRTLAIKGHWFPSGLKVFAELGGAPDARLHILLEMRPNGQSSVQIARPGDKSPTTLGFEQWKDGPLGEGFSYEDLLESHYFWSGQSLLDPAKYGARECDVLRSTPGPADHSHYAEVKTWLDQTIGYPVYVVKTLKATGTQKEFTYFGLRQTEGVWSASQVEAKVHGEAGSTLLIIDRGSPKAKLGLKDFGPEQLTHF